MREIPGTGCNNVAPLNLQPESWNTQSVRRKERKEEREKKT